jgi:hypothetical protein
MDPNLKELTMKKIIFTLLLIFVTTSATAQYHHGYRGGYAYHGPTVINNYHGGYGHHGGCYGCGVGAAIVGGAIVGGIVASAMTPHYVSPPVVYTSPPVYAAPIPYGYHYQQMLDPACNCYKTVLVPN